MQLPETIGAWGPKFQVCRANRMPRPNLTFVGNEPFGKYLQRNKDRHRATNIQSNWSGLCEYLKSVVRQR